MLFDTVAVQSLTKMKYFSIKLNQSEGALGKLGFL